MIINTEDELRSLYGWPKGRAKDKVLSSLEKNSVHFISCSPFLVLSTHDSSGKTDSSPRGGKAGFVKVLDNKNILIPDAKGNNRLDSLVNIIKTQQVGCLFFIPGINETLRINGKAQITTDAACLELFIDEQNPPKTCIKIEIEEVFLHCAKAFMRSELWEDTYKQYRPGFPTIGKMLNEQLSSTPSTESEEEMIERYKKDL